MEHCAPRDPQRVPKPKYEATAPQARLTIGYPNSTTGSMDNRTALLSGEATNAFLTRRRGRPYHDMSEGCLCGASVSRYVSDE
jgi:hypothetical protein